MRVRWCDLWVARAADAGFRTWAELAAPAAAVLAAAPPPDEATTQGRIEVLQDGGTIVIAPARRGPASAAGKGPGTPVFACCA